MKLIKISNDKKLYGIIKNGNGIKIKIKLIFNNYSTLIFFSINIIISIYLLLENKKNSKIIKDIIDFKSKFDYKHNNFKNEYPNDDFEMIGLNKPRINFAKIKASLVNYNIIASLIDLINQLEIKLIYLEKEIDITKLVSF